MDQISTATKLKSFWERPEGKTGMLFAAGGCVGLLLIMMKWGPDLVAAAQNTLVLGVYVLIACAIGYVLLDPRFRTMVGYMYKSLMRFITGLFIQIDPIGILKSYVEDLKKNHDRMNVQIGSLRGQMRILRQTMDQNTASLKENMALASQAQKKGVQAQVLLRTRKAGRLENSNKSYSDLLAKMEVLYRVLAKMYENCGVLIEDTEDQVKQKEIEYKTIKAAYGAMRSAMSIISGDKDKRAIYEQGLEFLADDLGTKVGEMERFMEMSQSFMEGVDIQNGVFEEKGLKMLEEWEKNADSLILGDAKAQIVADANDGSKVLDLDAPITAAPKVQMDSLFR